MTTMLRSQLLLHLLALAYVLLQVTEATAHHPFSAYPPCVRKVKCYTSTVNHGHGDLCCGNGEYYNLHKLGCEKVPGGGEIIHVASHQRSEIVSLNKHPSRINQYTACTPVGTLLLQCPSEFLYDPDVRECRGLDRINYGSNDFIRMLPCTCSGNFPLSYNDRLYYTCTPSTNGYSRVVHSCPLRMRFNPKRVRCEYEYSGRYPISARGCGSHCSYCTVSNESGSREMVTSVDGRSLEHRYKHHRRRSHELRSCECGHRHHRRRSHELRSCECGHRHRRMGSHEHGYETYTRPDSHICGSGSHEHRDRRHRLSSYEFNHVRHSSESCESRRRGSHEFSSESCDSNSDSHDSSSSESCNSSSDSSDSSSDTSSESCNSSSDSSDSSSDSKDSSSESCDSSSGSSESSDSSSDSSDCDSESSDSGSSDCDSGSSDSGSGSSDCDSESSDSDSSDCDSGSSDSGSSDSGSSDSGSSDCDSESSDSSSGSSDCNSESSDSDSGSSDSGSGSSDCDSSDSDSGSSDSDSCSSSSDRSTYECKCKSKSSGSCEWKSCHCKKRGKRRSGSFDSFDHQKKVDAANNSDRLDLTSIKYDAKLSKSLESGNKNSSTDDLRRNVTKSSHDEESEVKNKRVKSKSKNKQDKEKK